MSTPAQVPSKFSFANEGKDVLGDVLKDPNKQALSGETGTYFEPAAEEPLPQEKPVVTTDTTPPPPPPTLSTSTAPPPTEKLYAGKFKTPEDLEKSYIEIEKTFTTKAQEAAQAKKALEAAEAARRASPESIAATDEEARLKLINDFLTNPTGVIKDIESRVTESTRNQQETAAKVSAWRELNKDVVPYEDYIGVVTARLAAQDPNIDPWAAFDQATTLVRAEVGKIYERGKLEALSIQGSVTQTSAAKVNVPPPTEQPSKAPMSEQDAHQAHMAELRANAERVRRPVR